MSELKIDKGYHPKLKLPTDSSMFFRKCANILELHNNSRAKPCYSEPGLSVAYWQTAPSDDKEAGVILTTKGSAAHKFYIGVYDITSEIDLRNDATMVAEYAVDKLELAVTSLAIFLYPEFANSHDRYDQY